MTSSPETSPRPRHPAAIVIPISTCVKRPVGLPRALHETIPNRYSQSKRISKNHSFGGCAVAHTGGDFTTIGWKLDSTPSTRLKKRTFILQFLSSPSKDSSDFGEGKTFLGQIQVTTNRQGHAESDSASAFSPASKVPVGQFITATATERATGDTSEFSRARVVEEPGIGGSP